MLITLCGSSANKWDWLYCIVQMTLTQTPNSIISCNYFWDSPSVTSFCSQKSLSTGISLCLQSINNCYDFLLWPQLPLLMSLFSKVCKRPSSLAYCQVSSGDGQCYWCSRSPSFRSHSSFNCYESEERCLPFWRICHICLVDLQSIFV